MSSAASTEEIRDAYYKLASRLHPDVHGEGIDPDFRRRLTSVFSRVVETPVNESVNLREEHVNVERRPVDQPISPSDSTAFKEQSIEMRESAEENVKEER